MIELYHKATWSMDWLLDNVGKIALQMAKKLN